MARAPNEKVKKAKELYDKGYKLVDIAKELNIPSSTVRRWKSTYKWDNERSDIKSERSEKNKDLSWLEIEKEYVSDIGKKPCTLESLSKKYNIPIQTIKDYSANNNWSEKRTKYKQITTQKAIEKSANIASDKIANYEIKHLEISDKVLDEIKKALDCNPKELYTFVEKLRQGYGPGEFDEEITTHILNTLNDSKVVNIVNALDKLQKMQRQTLGILDAKDKKEKDEVNADEEEFKLPANLIAPAFSKVLFDIEEENHSEYLLSGGRGSTKSSFVGLEVINLIKKNPNMHACILRQVANTLRDSVFNQIKWAISALDLEEQFKTTLSPLEITYIPTGQKIYFRGADDPDKIKSIKVPFGYIGIAWFEELDQFAGPEAVRKIEQSIIRGGDKAFIFKSFNPPKTANNWANKYAKVPKTTRYDHVSTYLDVPQKWLGKPFIDEAEFLKSVNPSAYEHEYLGIANGNGGNIFDNVQIRTITNEELNTFDRVYNGVDWGWFPDPWAFNRMHYDSSRRTLYIFDEAHENKKSNKTTAKILKEKHNIKPNDKVTCDSAEPKSIDDYRVEGIFARGAIKGPGSVEYSMKWLQSLNAIVIDNSRCPNTATEFLDYEYERDKEGNVISGYPDINNHHIDAVRYAMEDVWKRRGQ